MDTQASPEPLAPKETAAQPFGKRIVVFLIIGLAIIFGAVVGYHYWQFASTHVTTDDAGLVSDVIQIAPQVSGTIQAIPVQDNQQVKKGDLLLTLDDATYQAAVAQARANLDVAIAQAKGAGVSVALTTDTGAAQLTQAEGVLSQAESSISGAQADVSRASAVISSADASAKGAVANIATARAGLSVAIQNKERAVAAVAGMTAQVDGANANVRAARAALDMAKANADKADRDAHRYSELLSKGAVSKQLADNMSTAASTAHAQVDAAQQQIEAAQAAVEAHKADLVTAQKQVNVADASVDQARAQVNASVEMSAAAAAVVQQAKAQREGSTQTVQQAIARRQQAQGQLSQAKTAPKQVDVSKSAQAQALAKITQARAALETALIQLRYTRIYAPSDGQVSKKSAEVGVLVQPGTPLMALVPNDRIWVVANFKETQLERMRQGQEVEVTVDALPKQHFLGHVDSVAAATGATFALLPADNATGNFTKVVQRIPVKITLDSHQEAFDRLRSGMSVIAHVKVR